VTILYTHRRCLTKKDCSALRSHAGRSASVSKGERSAKMSSKIPDAHEERWADQTLPGSDAPPSDDAPTIPSTVPTLPRGRLATTVRRAPPARRWALGAGLAIISGLVFVFPPFVAAPPVVAALALVAAFALALAAGFPLGSWWAAPALVVATAVGAWVGGWVVSQVSPVGAVGGLSAMDVASVVLTYVLFGLALLTAFQLAGIGIGKLSGIGLGRPRALSPGEARVSRWLSALAPLVTTGFLAGITGVVYTQAGVFGTLTGILYAFALASACALASWLLRPSRGWVVAPVGYVGVAALTLYLVGGLGGMSAFTMGFALYIVLPAIAMSAVGAAIGMSPIPQASERPGAEAPGDETLTA
jgi:hypothetical protein